MKRCVCFLLILSVLASLTGCAGKRAPAPAGEATCWRGGYGQAEISVLPGSDAGAYYVAGYRNNNPAAGVLDPQYVKAFLLDTGTAGGAVLLLSVDCVALSSGTVAKLRRDLRSLCRNVQVVSTHDHAGADTLGLWGPEGIDGKNPAMMRSLRQAARDAARQAVEDASAGELYFGSTDTADDQLQEDTRSPAVFDSALYSFRFVPEDKTKAPVRLLNYAAHAESLDSENQLISADFPAAAAERLAAEDGSRTLWFPGAIGGLIRTRFLDDDRVQNRTVTGQRIADCVLRIANGRRLPVSLRAERVEFDVRCENTLFLAMKFLGILDQRTAVRGGEVYLRTELNYLNVGGVPVLLIPGEVFPELVYGDQTGFQPLFPEKSLPTLCSLFGEDLLVFGLANDEIGYIVPPEQFLLNGSFPYLEDAPDDRGENHYEETNSPGPDTAEALYRAARRLAEKVGKK